MVGQIKLFLFRSIFTHFSVEALKYHQAKYSTLSCRIHAFLLNSSLWGIEYIYKTCKEQVNSALQSAMCHSACHCNIHLWNSWQLWFLAVWQSAWVSNEGKRLAVNANGMEQVTEKWMTTSFYCVHGSCQSRRFILFGQSVNRNQSCHVLFTFFLKEDKELHFPEWKHVRGFSDRLQRFNYL